MANPILRGTAAPQLQWWEVMFSNTQGTILKKEYKGIDIGQMSALCNSLSATHNGSLRFEKNIATLTLETTNPTGNIPGGINSPVSAITDKWEIAVEQEKPELWENKNWIALFETANSLYSLRVDQQVAHIIRQAANSSAPTWKGVWDLLAATNLVTNDGTDYAGPIKLSAIVTAIGPIYIKYFADDYLRGATNFLHGKYTLRHTTSAPNDYAANVADFNVEKIYTIAQLLTECQNGSLWYLPLPGYLAYKILSYSVPATIPPNYAWGALKTGSGAVTAAANRIEITTEYLIDAWPKHTYGLIS